MGYAIQRRRVVPKPGLSPLMAEIAVVGYELEGILTRMLRQLDAEREEAAKGTEDDERTDGNR